MTNVIVLSERDNVATALSELRKGDEVKVRNGEEGIVIRQDIPFGHKFAIIDIRKGENVLKYGEVIGRATEAIGSGDHVHVHNIESLRGRGDLTTGDRSSGEGT